MEMGQNIWLRIVNVNFFVSFLYTSHFLVCLLENRDRYVERNWSISTNVSLP